jgi:hypothetical protein
VICLQADLIAGGATRVVAPLVPRRSIPGTPGRFTPVIAIDDTEYIVLIDRMVNLPTRDLSRRVANLGRDREVLLGAIDLLFYGV